MPTPISEILQSIGARDLEVLVGVAETGSFRRAGLSLNMGQSAVSRRIQKLEELIGVSLFERSSTGARLTYAGSEFFACSSSIIENLKAAISRAQASGVADEGILHVGSMASFSNGPQREVIQTFAMQHPKVKLCFVETERSKMMTMLNHRTLDVVISVGEPTATHQDCLVLALAPAYLAVPSNSVWSELESVSWSTLKDVDFLISARESGPDIHDYIVRNASSFGNSASITRHQVSRDGILNLVGLGFGVTVVGDHASGTRYPNVTLVPLGGEDDYIPFSLFWRPENDNPALRRFISLARIEAKKNGVLA